MQMLRGKLIHEVGPVTLHEGVAEFSLGTWRMNVKTDLIPKISTKVYDSSILTLQF